MPAKAIPLMDRFWKFVAKSDDGCWEWTGARTSFGYGVIQVGRGIGIKRAHILSYETHYGPTGGLFVLHRCDNPPCIRPDHLFLGDNAANMADMSAKGRSRGQKQTHCKHGHEFNAENAHTDRRGYRLCRVCRRPKRRVNRTEEEQAASRKRMGAPRAAITHCPHGHPYDEENTLRRNGRRHCITCRNERRRNTSGLPDRGDAAL